MISETFCLCLFAVSVHTMRKYTYTIESSYKLRNTHRKRYKQFPICLFCICAEIQKRIDGREIARYVTTARPIASQYARTNSVLA